MQSPNQLCVRDRFAHAGKHRDLLRRRSAAGCGGCRDLTPPKSALLLARCDLARPAAGGCAWCGSALTPRRRTWCSTRCGTAFWTNHWWTLARRATKRRDKYRCRTCGAAAPKRPARAAQTSDAAYRAALRIWRAGKQTQRMEVNHRVPCRGKHGMLSCDHHLDNLETLCVACHREVTLNDRQARTILAATPASDGIQLRK